MCPNSYSTSAAPEIEENTEAVEDPELCREVRPGRMDAIVALLEGGGAAGNGMRAASLRRYVLVPAGIVSGQ